MSSAQAWLVAVGVLCSPVGYYASFFMPEILFFLSISLLVLAMLSLTNQSKYITWLILGLGLGVAALTKPHALFFGAVIAIYIIYLEASSGKLKISVAAAKIFAAALGSVLSKFIIGFIFAGPSGLSLFGSSYSGAISTAGPALATTPNSAEEAAGIQTGPMAFFSVFGLQTWGHLLAAAVLFLVPISAAFILLNSRTDEFGSRTLQKKVSVISLGSVAVGIITIALFTALVTVNGSDHADRIMVRYYDYIVPFMYLIVGMLFSLDLKGKLKLNVKIILVALLATSLIGSALNLSPFKPAFYDGTSLAASKSDSWFNWVLLAISIASLIAIFSNSKLKKYLLALLLLGMTFGLSFVGAKNIDPLREPDRFDAAANFVSSYLEEDELSSLTVIAHEDYALARALMLIDNPNVDYRVIGRGETFGAKFLDEGKEWALLIGNSFIDQPGCLRHQGSGYVLVKLCDTPEFYFNQLLPTSFIDSVDGISYPEDWGSWTVGNRAVINFSEPLKANSKIQITMATPEYNQDQIFVATLGGSSIEFNLTTEPIDGTFEFENTSESSQLIFEIPEPKSEKEQGISSDSREGGIRLYKVKVLN